MGGSSRETGATPRLTPRPTPTLLDEAGGIPTRQDVDWWTSAQISIKQNMNDPDSFKFTGDWDLPQFTQPHLIKYEGRGAWKIDRFYYRAKNGFGGLILTYATLIVRNKQLMEYSVR
jgi:hypothetical protein